VGSKLPFFLFQTYILVGMKVSICEHRNKLQTDLTMK